MNSYSLCCVFMVHPSPAPWVVALHAASVFTTVQFSPIRVRGGLLVVDGFSLLVTWLFVHSRAMLTAFVIVSSADVVFPSKISWFLAHQICHNIQDANWPETIPIGGRQDLPHRSSQLLYKSINPLSSMAVAKGAFLQISSANGHCRNR